MSKSRVERTLFCDKQGTKAHVLARVRVEVDGERTVEVPKEAKATPGGVAPVQPTPAYRQWAVEDDLLALGVKAMCSCGRFFWMDLAALLRGEESTPRRVPPDYSTDVSPDRRTDDPVA